MRPGDDGTMIVASASDYDNKHIITGIAGRRGFSVFTVEDDLMNSQIGYGRRMLEVFEENGIAFEHMPTGIDTMSVIVATADIDPIREKLIASLNRTLKPDSITVDDGLALIAVVGRGMVKAKGTAARVFSAVSNAEVNIKMIDQGSSELNIILGVEERDFEVCVKAIYDEFVND
jgi:aspartate kinase